MEAAASPVHVPRVVAVVLPSDLGIDGLCETLCQRLLYNHAAQRVIVTVEKMPGSGKAGKAPRMFSIEHRRDCPDPPVSADEVVWPHDGGARVLNRVRSLVAMGECLVETAPAAIDKVQLTIAYRIVSEKWWVFMKPWVLPIDTIGANRVELIDAEGQVFYRRTEVRAGLLMQPLTVTAGMSLLSSVRYIGWARRDVKYSEVDLNGRKVLADLLGSAARPPDPPEWL